MYNGKPVRTTSNINKTPKKEVKEIETYSDLSSSIRNSLDLQPRVSKARKRNTNRQPVQKTVENKPATNNQRIKKPVMSQPQTKALQIAKNNTQPVISKARKENNTRKESSKSLNEIIEDYSNTEERNLANKTQNKVLEILSDETKELTPEQKKKTIALLLPMSGKYKKIGTNLLNSAEMAIFDINNPNIILKTYDTKASPKGATNAFIKARKDKPSIILGPVFSRSTRAIIPLANKTDIPVLSYSNDVTLAGKGIYLLGFNPLEQIRKVVEYAHSQNIEFFASLAPENNYGILTTKVLSDYLHKNELKPANMQWYLKADESLSKSLKILSKQTEKFPPLSVALLIPEGGRTLSSISKRLFDGNLQNSQFRLLGSGEWDSSKVIKNKSLAGSWFATSPSKKRRTFRKKFVDYFSYTPIRIASIAYDSIIASDHILATNSNRISKESIKKIDFFKGTNGLFRFNKDGTTKRALSIIEITNSGFSIAKPADNSF